MVGGVFNSGVTATGPIPGAKYNYLDATPEEMDRVTKIQAVCKAHSPLAAAALQFPLAHPIVASIIPGAISPDQVRQNIQHCRHPIPAANVKMICIAAVDAMSFICNRRGDSHAGRRGLPTPAARVRAR